MVEHSTALDGAVEKTSWKRDLSLGEAFLREGMVSAKTLSQEYLGVKETPRGSIWVQWS